MTTTSSGNYSSNSFCLLKCSWDMLPEIHHVLCKLSLSDTEIKSTKLLILSFFDGFKKISSSWLGSMEPCRKMLCALSTVFIHLRRYGTLLVRNTIGSLLLGS